jgi:CheY-like chemotaxis protein
MKKILLVDDSEENLFVLRILLEGHNFETFSARSGKDALEILERLVIEIVISDLEMENGNGLWLLDQIVKMRVRPHVIILSGDPTTNEKRLKLSGAQAFFRKPCMPDDLIHYVKGL